MKPGRQSGYALILVLILTATASVVVAAPYLSRLAFDTNPIAVTLRSANALKEAREALIAYAAIEDNTPGSLPCPDQDNDGEAQSGIGGDICAAPYIGRLPWKTLGLGKLTDGDGECLWYALSAEFRNTIKTAERGTELTKPALNLSTQASIDASTSANPAIPFVVAAIFAPGRPLLEQTRGAPALHRCATGNPADFLESANSSGNSVTQAVESASFNDFSLTLTSQQLFVVIGKRVLGTLANGEPYGGRGLPRLVTDKALTAYDIEEKNIDGTLPPRPTPSSPDYRIQRRDNSKYLVHEFDDALQSMLPAKGKVHYVPDQNFFDPVSGCHNYSPKYTKLDGNEGSVQSYHPKVAPAEWLCRNRWYDYVAYQANTETSAKIWLDSSVSTISLDIKF